MSSVSVTQPKVPTKRLSSDERREQIIEAAMAVFGARGYVGTTTDEVAKAAGVSQPYVVRLFGSKESLFLATLEDALERLVEAFRAALDSTLVVDGIELPPEKRIGKAYVDLLDVRGLHQSLAHAYLLGSHPMIGPAARAGFARIWHFFREEAGFSPDYAREFMAEGMLISTMIGLRLVDDYGKEPAITELFLACFPTEIASVLEIIPRGDEPW